MWTGPRDQSTTGYHWPPQPRHNDNGRWIQDTGTPRPQSAITAIYGTKSMVTVSIQIGTTMVTAIATMAVRIGIMLIQWLLSNAGTQGVQLRSRRQWLDRRYNLYGAGLGRLEPILECHLGKWCPIGPIQGENRVKIMCFQGENSVFLGPQIGLLQRCFKRVCFRAYLAPGLPGFVRYLLRALQRFSYQVGLMTKKVAISDHPFH